VCLGIEVVVELLKKVSAMCALVLVGATNDEYIPLAQLVCVIC